MTPEWSDFKILVALSRAGSVAGAARELGVDSSTISRRLAALEEAIGARLLIRGGREFSWTTEGRAAVAAAETMEQAVDQAVRTCRAATLDASGSVAVSAPPALVPILFAKLIPLARDRYPNLKLELSGDYARRDLAKGEADIVVRMVKPTEPDLISRRVLDANWYAYASAEYLAEHGRPVDFDGLRTHPLVLYKETMHGVEAFRWLEGYRADQPVTRVDNIEVAAQLVVAGFGIGVMPALLEFAVPALVRVFETPATHTTGYVVYHETSRDAARVRAAAELLHEVFEREHAVFSGPPRG